jgi:hypothetical protein
MGLKGSKELMMGSKLFDAPQIDSATIDYYLARGRRERARAISEMIRGIFSSPERKSAEVHALPVPLPVGDRAKPAPNAGRRAA